MKKALSLALALMMLLSMCIVPAVAAAADGSADYPYYVANPMAAPGTITIPANSTVYYQYKAAVFNGWEVGGMGLSAITVDGVVYDEKDMWGEIYAPLKFNFMSPGVVGYVNNTDEDVEVLINHNEPVGTESNPDELVAGENIFTIPANNPSYVAEYYPTASGEYTFECAQGEDFIISVEVEENAYTVDGSLTLNLESYIPVRIYISPIGNTPNVTLNLTVPKAGTETNPIWLSADTMELAYTLTGTEPMYFSVDGSLTGSKLLVESKNGTALNMELDGVAYTADTGALSLDLDTSEWVMSLVISQAADADNELYFSVEYAAGSYDNPIELVDGDNAISVPENGNYYYSYTAAKGGLLVITPADVAQFDLLDIGYEDAEYNYHYGYLAEGASSAILPVPAGQTVIIGACGVIDEDTFVSAAIDTTLNVVMKDLLLFNTFEGADLEGDLEGWLSSSDLVLEEAGEESNVANGFYSAEFNVTKDWGNIYRHANVEANTNYEVTFKAKAAKNGGLWVKFHKDDWSGDIAQGDIALTTEWAEYTTIINSGDNTSLWLLLQYAGYAADGQIIWLDDIVITKVEGGSTPDVPVEPAFGFVNGGFETGDASGWETWQSTSISADAAKDGAFGAHLVGNGGWGGLLNQTIAVEAGKQYKLSFWINVNATGVNVQVKNGSGASIEGAGGWFDGNKKDHLVEWVFTATDDKVLVNFCGSGSAPEDAYVDNFVLAEVKPASFDGYIYNGDFETGDLVNWTNLWDSCTYEFVEGYESGNAISITAGGWSQIRQNGIKVEPNTDYVLTAWIKNANNFGVIIKNGDDSSDITSYYIESVGEWTQISVPFNSADQSEVCVLLIGWDGGGSAIIDNVSMALDLGDDPVVPPVTPDVLGFVNGDFETGDATGWETWQSTSISADAAKDSAFGAHLVGNGGWGGLLNQTIAVEAGKQYKLSFWINVNNNGVNVQVKDGAGNSIEGAGGWFDANNKDKLVEWVFTATDNSVLINFCGGGNGVAEDVYVDNFVLSEVKTASFDGFITNGDFETGDNTGWEIWQSTSISADAAKDGAFGAHLVGNGGWGGLLNQTIAVEAGKQYKLSFWINVNNNGVNVQVKDGAGNSIEGAGGWFDANNKDKLVEWVFTATDNSVLINFCGGGNGVAEDAYVDNFVLAEVKPASFDGYIYNGDFETGDLVNWTNLWDSCTYEFVEGYESGNAISITAGGWSQIRQNGIKVEANTDYVLTAWVKNSANFGIIIKNGDDSSDIVNIIPETSAEWTQVTLKFNSGDQTEICVLLIGWEGGGSAIIDNVSLAKDETPVEITYGDVDGNGKINNRDLGRLQQYLNEWDVEINLDACDVDGNGKVNNRDLGRLQQYLNEWDVVLGG